MSKEGRGSLAVLIDVDLVDSEIHCTRRFYLDDGPSWSPVQNESWALGSVDMMLGELTTWLESIVHAFLRTHGVQVELPFP